MMPIEDALERADRREREYIAALDGHEKRVAGLWERFRLARRVERASTAVAFAACGAGLYEWRFGFVVAVAFAIAASAARIAGRAVRSVDEETKRFDALRRSE